MSWEKEPLLAKSKLFFEKAYLEEKESPFFGLWCSMGLELLARSSLASISPTLLAEPDREHQNLLHALNLGSATSQRKSLPTLQVLLLCKTLIVEFTDSNFKIASALVNRRNEEVHTGSAAFSEYPTQQWIAGFYQCCKILSEFQGESLLTLFGEDIQKEANIILAEVKEEVLSKTMSLIAAHRKVFENKENKDQEQLKVEAQEYADRFAYRRHHRVECPSCHCTATVTGEPYGKENIENKEDEIIVRQSILPTKFQCTACELKLNGYNALSAAGVANHYTRKTTYSPEEYYDMIHPDDFDKISERFIELNPASAGYEWDNE